MQTEFLSSINLIDHLSKSDWIIFIVIFAITLFAVVYGQKLKAKHAHSRSENESFLDLLIMGRQLTLPLFVGTLVATWYGGIFGVTQIAYEKGIYNFITQGVFWYITYGLFAFFLVDRIQKFRAVTLPDLISKMFGPISGKLGAIFNFFNIIPVVYTISLGLIMQAIFGGSLLENIVPCLLVVTLYSMFGGFRAVVFSDLVQFFVMCASVALVLFFSVSLFGGISFLSESLPDSHFSPTGGESIFTLAVWGLIALSTLVDPNFYQRCFAAQSSKVAKRGILISTLVWVGFDLCTTFGALYARAVLPEASSSQAYLTYSIQLLPEGLRGFFLAGLVATILSTIDSYIHIGGTTLSYDLMPKKWKGKTITHYIGILIVAGVTLLLATAFEGNIRLVWKTLGSYSAACLLLPVLYGYLRPGRITDMQFVVTCLLGVVATTYWRLAEHSEFWAQFDEIYAGIFATSLGLLISHFWSAKTHLKQSDSC